MKYLYDSHIGGLYTSDKELSFETRYCKICGDFDCLIGSFETIQDFWNLIKDKCDINGSGGYSLQYAYLLLVSEFNLPDDVKYNNIYDRICSNSEKEILSRINELVKENNDGLSE